MTDRSRLAAYHLTFRDGLFLDQSGDTFPAAHYSLFKHGWSAPPRLWGYRLAELLIEQRPDIAFDTRPLVVTGAPYETAPKPAVSIAHFFWQAINYHRSLRALEAARLVQIYHPTTPPNNYAALSAEERLALLQAAHFQIDHEPLQGAHFLPVDDIRISGTAENNTASLVAGISMASVTYLYGAILDPEVAAVQPDLEFKLNRAAEVTLEVIDGFIRAGEYYLSKRAMDYILGWSDQDELREFLLRRDGSFLEHLYTSAVGTTSLRERWLVKEVDDEGITTVVADPFATLESVIREKNLPLSQLLRQSVNV